MSLISIVMVVGYFVFCVDRNLTVYDDKFEILEYRLSIGKTHRMYEGNQIAGRIRTTLRDRFGLKFIGPPWMTVLRAHESRVLLLRYTGDFPYKELDGLGAVLTNDKEIYKELIGIKIPTPAKQVFVRGYILPSLPISDDSFRIEFKLKSSDKPIASLELGELYAHNIGNNSDP